MPAEHFRKKFSHFTPYLGGTVTVLYQNGSGVIQLDDGIAVLFYVRDGRRVIPGEEYPLFTSHPLDSDRPLTVGTRIFCHRSRRSSIEVWTFLDEYEEAKGSSTQAHSVAE